MKTLLVLVAMLASFSAWSQDDNKSYFGVSAAFSDQGGVCQEDDDLNGRTRCTGTNLLRLFGGHHFHQHFAIEGAAVAAERTSGGGLELAAVGIAPVTEHFAFYGRVGGAFAESSALTLAVGVRFHLGENFGLRFEWQGYNAGIDLLSAGVFVRF
jgi:hypothetical protein